MIKEFQFSFDELNINPEDLSEFLGFTDGVVPEPFPEIIQEALKDAPQFCEIKGGYKIFDSIEVNLKEDTFRIGNQTFLPSKIVTTHLKNSTYAAIFICTAGSEITNQAKELTNNGDTLLAYIFDVIGSVAVEKATDRIQNSLKNELQKSEHNISDRYSPGYCEWDVAEQQKLFRLMPHNFCGVALSKSSLMNPVKSLSGIIGIGTEMEQKGYQCHWCTDKNCMYGKIKKQKKA